MNFTNLLNGLNQANLFDLYRLHVAIGNELENPKRIMAIKQLLRIGMKISYFSHVENRCIKATLLALKQKNVVVLDREQNKRFIIPYYMLNTTSIDTEIYEAKNTDALTPNNLKVGDWVGFNKDGECIAGMIKRLNHKTVTLITKSGSQWRVAYSFLFRIHAAESAIHSDQHKNIMI